MRAWANDKSDAIVSTITEMTRIGSATANVNTTPNNGSGHQAPRNLTPIRSRTSRFLRTHLKKILLLLMALIILLILIALLIFIRIYVKQNTRQTVPIRTCMSKECLRSAANLILSMDSAVNPCDDFYQYSCGNWAKEHPRPDSHTFYDWYSHKDIEVHAIVRDFLTNRSRQRLESIPVQQARDLYQACMDTNTSNGLGLKPVFKILEDLKLPPYPTIINATDDVNANYSFHWLDTVIKIKTLLDMDVLIGFYIIGDPKNSSAYRLGMGSPYNVYPFHNILNRKNKHKLRHFTRHQDEATDYKMFIPDTKQFFDLDVERKKDASSKTYSKYYNSFYIELINMFAMESHKLKNSTLDKTKIDNNINLTSYEYFRVSNELFKMETNEDEIDDIYLKPVEYTAEEIQNQTDTFIIDNNGTELPIWRRYLEGVFNTSIVSLDFEMDKILVTSSDLDYMKSLALFISTSQPMVLELYIWVKVVQVLAEHSTEEMRMVYQRLYDSIQYRHHITPTRSRYCVDLTIDLLGLAVASAVDNPKFYNVTKPKVESMLMELKNSMAHLVGTAKWMDDNTKVATYRKIILMETILGFPWWFPEKGKLEEYYRGITDISAKTHLENIMRIVQWYFKNDLDYYRHKKEKTFGVYPTEVNAYYTRHDNVITLPIVMLQYPFYDLGLESLNYGAIGTVLGHEMTHGFDNSGRKYDKDGNYLPWWSNSSITAFKETTQCFINQYSNYYVPEINENLDGKKTLDENIADNGGMRAAFAAFKRHLRKHNPEEKLPGFEHLSSEQMFFISYGNLWCGTSTSVYLEDSVKDSHAPQRYRLHGALVNSEEFARTWNCLAGSHMSPKKSCVIY